jgi:hypothetical protein
MGNALHVYVFCVMGRLRVMYMWIIGERGFLLPGNRNRGAGLCSLE